LWEDEALQLPLKERHKLFLQTARKNIKTWDRYVPTTMFFSVVMPWRADSLFVGMQLGRFKVRIDRHSNILSQAYKQFSEVAPNKIRSVLYLAPSCPFPFLLVDVWRTLT